MAHKITDECIGCGSCEPECAANAISQDGDKFKIDPSKCTDCGNCVSVCPVNAIVKE